LAVTGLALSACASPDGNTTNERREAVDAMAHETLKRLYAEVPDAEQKIANSAGHGVFSNYGVQVIFVGGGGGYGVVTDYSDNSKTYMRVGQVSAGLGIAAKEFRAVFYFDNEAALDHFTENGWTFGGSADAAARDTKGTGGSAETRDTVASAIHVYQITETGVSLQATVDGTKYWKDEELNTYD
jgi:lipid-binding SYLF domain-containing protein